MNSVFIKRFLLPFRLWMAGMFLSLTGCTTVPQLHEPIAIEPFMLLPESLSQHKNLSSFDIYRSDRVLYAVAALSTKEAKSSEIFFVSSLDEGRTWSQPQKIPEPFNQQLESKLGNDIQIAAFGQTVMIVWQVTGEIPGMGPLYAILSKDGGHHWQQINNPTQANIDQSHADLVSDSLGNFHIIWLDDRDENGYQGLRYARFDPLTSQWQQSQTLDGNTCSCCWNRLQVYGEQKLRALYRDGEFRDMALMDSQDNGLNWQPFGHVGDFQWKFDGCPHNGGALGQAAEGHRLHSLVWTGAEQKTGLYYLHSDDEGHHWSIPQQIAARGFHSDLAVLDPQTLAIIWDELGPEGSTILLSFSIDNGISWSKPTTLTTSETNGSFPRLISTQSGWIALWTEQKKKTKILRSVLLN